MKGSSWSICTHCQTHQKTISKTSLKPWITSSIIKSMSVCFLGKKRLSPITCNACQIWSLCHNITCHCILHCRSPLNPIFSNLGILKSKRKGKERHYLLSIKYFTSSFLDIIYTTDGDLLNSALLI